MIRVLTTTAMLAAVSGVTIAAGAGAGAGAGAPSGPPRPGYALLPGSAVPFASNGRAGGAVAGYRRLTIQVWLAPRTAAAERFATAVSSPRSPAFRRYLSPAAYTSRFAASPAAAARVSAWLRSAGFTGVHADPTRSYVRATAAVSVIDAALRTRLRTYRPPTGTSTAGVSAGRYALRANASPLSVPAALAGTVLGVTGLDNAAPLLRPAAARRAGPASARRPAVSTRTAPCSRYYGQFTQTVGIRRFGTTRFPSAICGYTARQLRKAYGANSVSTGTGQRIAQIEQSVAPALLHGLRIYAKAGGLPAPSGSRFRQLALGHSCVEAPTREFEEILEFADVEMSYTMAPGAHQLVVAASTCDTGDAGLQGLFDADLKVLGGSGRRPLATIVVNDWEIGPEDLGGSLASITHAFLVRAAAEGVGMYFSSTGPAAGVETPASDPFAISVGGTSLGIGKHGQRLFETGYSDDVILVRGRTTLTQGVTGSGGGPSLLWREPAYQRGVVPAALTTADGNRGFASRSVPDIGADADPVTGVGFDIVFPHTPPEGSGPFAFANTSPTALVAGMVADAQQGQAKPFGFINPVLYKLAGTTAFNRVLPFTSRTPVADRAVVCADACLHLGVFAFFSVFDIQAGHLPGYVGQVTLPRYGNMAGLGSPNGQAFIEALRRCVPAGRRARPTRRPARGQRRRACAECC